MAKKPVTEESKPDSEPTFEQLLQELDTIVQELEAGQLGLTESLTRYEQGIRHLRRCYQVLEQAERRVAVVTGVDPNGAPQLQPFVEQSASLEEKALMRSERRSHR